MHWTQCTVVAQFDGASPRPAQRFTPESFLAWVAAQQTEAHEVHSCYEAGAFGYGLHRRLVALGIKNVVVRPRDWDEYHKKVKTGRRDAPALCGMLVRWQALLLEMDRQIAALTALIEAADAGERPVGVGALTAGTLDREAGDWRRFQNRREVASYTGLIPGEHSSGANHRQGAITKHGNRRMRTSALETAWRLLRFQPDCHAVKRLGPALQEARLRGQSARRRKLIVALARQFVVDWWRLRTARATPAQPGLRLTTRLPARPPPHNLPPS